MSLMTRLRQWFCPQRKDWPATIRLDGDKIGPLIHAQGQLLALISTILERGQVVTALELSHSLREFAGLSESDATPEGEILALWAAYVESGASALADQPSTH